MSDILKVSIKGFVAVVYLFLVVKAVGKKQISELNIFDYIIGISLGNIAAETAVNKEVSILMGIIIMSIFGVVSLLISYITSKSIKARRYITGYPVVLMNNGLISRKQLKKVKIDLNDLMQDARENGYFDLSEIECAIMEVSGRVSFLPKSKYKPVTNNDMKIKTNYESMCANLVIDGKIMPNNLKNIGKDEKWLLKRLSNMGYEHVEDILLVICDSKEELTIYPIDYEIDKEILE